jgi:hypothetical protein
MPSRSWKGTGPYLGAAASGRRAAQATGRVNADQPPRTAAFRAARPVAGIHGSVAPLTGRRRTAHRIAARYTSGTSQVYQRSTPGPYSESVWEGQDPSPGVRIPAIPQSATTTGTIRRCRQHPPRIRAASSNYGLLPPPAGTPGMPAMRFCGTGSAAGPSAGARAARRLSTKAAAARRVSGNAKRATAAARWYPALARL